MKIRTFIKVMLLALIVAAPQVQAQSKQAERKLKREMRKLEKQMEKVQELKKMDYFQVEMGDMQRKMALKQREMARGQALKAQELARVYERKNFDWSRELERKVSDQTRKAMELQRHELSKIREIYPDGSAFHLEIPDIEMEIPNVPKFYGEHMSIFEPGNTLSVKKSMDNESVEKDHNYTVSEEATAMDLKISGSVEEGEISIILKTPEGKEYQKVELTPAADVNWSQKVKIEGKENYKGEWTISVKGEKAKGNYSIYMRSK